MKLRLLNGAHSALAYLGLLAGHATVAEAAGDAALAGFLRGFWAEVAPTLPSPPGIAPQDYTTQLLRRFRNRALRHLLAQIAMDGSQKLPQRLLGPARERLAQGLPARHLALAVAAWIRHLDGQGGAPVRDPLAAQLRAALAAVAEEPAARGRAVLGFAPVFGADLAQDGRFAAAVGTACRALAERGVAAALAMPDR
jgi:fructuronate reductase